MIIRGSFVIVMFPLIAFLWLVRWIDDYGSEFIYWVDDLVEKLCGYYVDCRKK